MSDKPLFEPCPLCGSTWNIKRVKSLTHKVWNKSYCCDTCHFHAGQRATWRAARHRWNRLAKAYIEGFEAVKPIIMKQLDAEIKRRMEEMREQQKSFGGGENDS